VSVELYSIAGGGHTWPGADIDLGPADATTQTVDATQLTLDFFEAHPRNAR
jgi:polyhydroxybutyrate depolymerase